MSTALGNCPSCKSVRHRVVAELGDRDRRFRFQCFSDLKYAGLLMDWLEEIPPTILSCEECGHCWYAYQPNAKQLAQMYESGRPLLSHGGVSREPSQHMRYEMSRLRKLVGKRVASPPRLLDYGSGYGRWARAAALEGFEVTAYEPSLSRGAESETVGFELVSELSALGGRRYDVINLEQVLEHLPDPAQTLQQIRVLCTKKTIIRISVPNILRAPEKDHIWLTWPFDGERPHIMSPFEHLHGFTPDSLERLLSRAGLIPITGANAWRLYPLDHIRKFLSPFFPGVGKTVAVVSVNW